MAQSNIPYQEFQDDLVENSETENPVAAGINTSVHHAPADKEAPLTGQGLDEALITDYRSYPHRWYVLFMFAVLGMEINMVFSTFSPIANFAEPALSLTQTDISLLANWYNIMFVVGVFPYMWLIQVKGLRMPIVSGAVFVCAGAFIRCLHTGGMLPMFDKAMLHLGQAINGLASSVLWFACSKISAVWFPPHERPLSTSIGLMTGGLGVAFNFLVGPYTVKTLAKKFAGDYDPTDENYALAIRFLLYVESVVCALLCLLTLLYYPSVPPTPPSYSASSVRMSFWQGMKHFAVSLDAWIIFLLYSITASVMAGWTQFLTITVKDIMDDIQAGWLGFALTVAQFISAPIASATASHWFHSRPKLVCASLLFIGASLTVVFWIAEAFVRSIYSPALCWGTLIPAALFISAAQPMWWEMACEAVYPVPEQIVSGIFALGYVVASIFFFLMYSFPIGTQWANWCLAISECACVPLIFFYSGKKRRLAEDQEADERRRTDLVQSEQNS